MILLLGGWYRDGLAQLDVAAVGRDRLPQQRHHAAHHLVDWEVDQEVRVAVLGRLLEVDEDEFPAISDGVERELGGRADAEGGAHANAEVALAQRGLGRDKLALGQRVLPVQEVVAQSAAAAWPRAHAPCFAAADPAHVKVAKVFHPAHLACLHEEVSVQLRKIRARDPGPQMQAVNILADHQTDVPGVHQPDERHVRQGRVRNIERS
mmetsp:Transcript_21106/g.42575  ORF Transcript_21106/g.42575 Transcript_21106/m.42575 type:complete len:208 (+) Transcript_21106:361-984(+)